MHIITASTLAALACAFAPILALPTASDTPPALVRRIVHCANAPATVAGSLLARRSSALGPALSPREPGPLIWCDHGSTTYIAVTRSASPVPDQKGESFPLLLRSAYEQTQQRVRLGIGDVASAGVFASQSGTAVLVRPVSSGKTVEGKTVGARPMTWTVLGEAVRALTDMMKERGGMECTFVIYSGAVLVGEGSVRV